MFYGKDSHKVTDKISTCKKQQNCQENKQKHPVEITNEPIYSSVLQLQKLYGNQAVLQLLKQDIEPEHFNESKLKTVLQMYRLFGNRALCQMLIKTNLKTVQNQTLNTIPTKSAIQCKSLVYVDSDFTSDPKIIQSWLEKKGYKIDIKLLTTFLEKGDTKYTNEDQETFFNDLKKFQHNSFKIKLHNEKDVPRVVIREYYKNNGKYSKVVKTEKVIVYNPKETTDIEINHHEHIHIDQLGRFERAGKSIVTERVFDLGNDKYEIMKPKKDVRIISKPGMLTMWQNAVCEYEAYLNEFLNTYTPKMIMKIYSNDDQEDIRKLQFMEDYIKKFQYEIFKRGVLTSTGKKHKWVMEFFPNLLYLQDSVFKKFNYLKIKNPRMWNESPYKDKKLKGEILDTFQNNEEIPQIINKINELIKEINSSIPTECLKKAVEILQNDSNKIKAIRLLERIIKKSNNLLNLKMNKPKSKQENLVEKQNNLVKKAKIYEKYADICENIIEDIKKLYSKKK
jgi:hypothetical protein